jgi:hypothetical protein
MRLSKVVKQIKLHIILKFQKYATDSYDSRSTFVFRPILNFSSFSILNTKSASKTYFLRLSKVVEKSKLHIILKFQKYTTDS